MLESNCFKRIYMRKLIKDFLAHEASAGVLLFVFAVVAIVIKNTELAIYYDDFLNKQNIGLSFGDAMFSMSIGYWINDALMAIFFFLVGMEIKREIFIGELSSPSRIVFPVVAAVGGALFPALIFTFFNYSDPVAMQGWAIPCATDIAFALGVLMLLGDRIPGSVKLFLLSVAIIDDLMGISIIALFYTEELSMHMLAYALFTFLILLGFSWKGVQSKLFYILGGVVLWALVHASGVHATIAGVLLAFTIPLQKPKGHSESVLEEFEHALEPWVAFLILPIFAFANAGVSFAGFSFGDILNGVSIGVILGLFIGKQIGVFGTAILLHKLKLIKKPSNMTWSHLYGVSLLAGIGFTLSLFIGGLAYSDPVYIDQMKIGVLIGSFISAVIGYCYLRAKKS